MRTFDIGIVGAGAAGLMAAGILGEGHSVVLFEAGETPGKKLSQTGAGRCNFTNANMSPEKYYAGDLSFVKQVLSRFSTKDTLSYFEKLGIYAVSEGGYYYPRSLEAKSFRDRMVKQAEQQGVLCKWNNAVTNIMKQENGFLLSASGVDYFCKKVLFCCGGKSFLPKEVRYNADLLCKELGHNLKEQTPALLPLKVSDSPFKKATGVRVNVRISYKKKENKDAAILETGQLQISEDGISGICVFNLSHGILEELKQTKKVPVTLSFLPDLSRKEKKAMLSSLKENHPEENWRSLLTGVLPYKLIPALVEGNESLEEVLLKLDEFPLTVTGAGDSKKAQVTSGGILLSDIDPETMESKLVPGLYFAGEVMDVDGMCGGYNLQWAFSTAYLAAEAMNQSL